MPEIRELESFEDFEDAIHNGPTKDCFKTPVCCRGSMDRGPGFESDYELEGLKFNLCGS